MRHVGGGLRKVGGGAREGQLAADQLIGLGCKRRGARRVARQLGGGAAQAGSRRNREVAARDQRLGVGRGLGQDGGAAVDRLQGPVPLEIGLVALVDVEQQVRPGQRLPLLRAGEEAGRGDGVRPRVVGEDVAAAELRQLGRRARRSPARGAASTPP